MDSAAQHTRDSRQRRVPAGASDGRGGQFAVSTRADDPVIAAAAASDTANGIDNDVLRFKTAAGVDVVVERDDETGCWDDPTPFSSTVLRQFMAGTRLRKTPEEVAAVTTHVVVDMLNDGDITDNERQIDAAVKAVQHSGSRALLSEKSRDRLRSRDLGAWGSGRADYLELSDSDLSLVWMQAYRKGWDLIVETTGWEIETARRSNLWRGFLSWDVWGRLAGYADCDDLNADCDDLDAVLYQGETGHLASSILEGFNNTDWEHLQQRCAPTKDDANADPLKYLSSGIASSLNVLIRCAVSDPSLNSAVKARIGDLPEWLQHPRTQKRPRPDK